MQVFLIRHPPPCVEAGICYGRLDLDCADPAPYAAALHPLIPPGTLIFSSPLRRARRLAEALAQALEADLRLDDRLREIDFGAWEGQRWDAIARPEIDAWAADVLGYAPPGGESVAALQIRAHAFADALEADGHAHAAVVSHAGMLRALVGRWRDLPVDEWTQLAFAYGGLSVLDLARPPSP